MCKDIIKIIGHSLKGFAPFSENSSPPMVSQAGYGPDPGTKSLKERAL